jgi:hypothetical protein
MADVARLTAVASQREAEVICSLLRAYGIRCSERAASESGEPSQSYTTLQAIRNPPAEDTESESSVIPR